MDVWNAIWLVIVNLGLWLPLLMIIGGGIVFLAILALIDAWCWVSDHVSLWLIRNIED